VIGRISLSRNSYADALQLQFVPAAAAPDGFFIKGHGCSAQGLNGLARLRRRAALTFQRDANAAATAPIARAIQKRKTFFDFQSHRSIPARRNASPPGKRSPP